MLICRGTEPNPLTLPLLQDIESDSSRMRCASSFARNGDGVVPKRGILAHFDGHG